MTGLVDTVQCESMFVGIHRIVGRHPYRVVEEDSQPIEEYTVKWPFVLEVINGSGVEPTLDCFAAEGNQRCSRYFTKQDDSLSQVWPLSEALWLNFPGNFGIKRVRNF